MTRIAAIGECMIEMAPTGPAGLYRMGFAGDTLNTAWYLRQLLPAADRIDYVTAVGRDAASDQMLDFLRGADLGVDHIARSSDRTVGLYMIQLQDGERSFSYWRGQSAARTLADDPAALTEALSGADLAVFSGITLAILPPAGREALLEALAELRGRGGTIVFDPNLRPRLWASPSEMTGAITRAAAVSDIALPSHEDEAAWFGDADPEATAARYAGSGVGCVIVKNGPGPVLARVAGVQTWHETQAVETVVDTTAAGDSFNAGYLAAQLQGRSIDEAVAAAAGLAGRVIRSHGALVPIA
ncbi:sugar kinase [Roseisalinus antarcticus]|uniref:2-dehydro-3-deoxygluconokinase n=1 Tax=Roseisalinus antarcticus TaxID=254357 RepID=A0A1Y5RLB0_9RHOB|nr:sugar kinase [Roseisalinus antarcticus]SLN20153.1 2-dehydro-3-deoxygluconokinase [Roseisalinus antarcticus]